jgi:hypothetical protein
MIQFLFSKFLFKKNLFLKIFPDTVLEGFFFYFERNHHYDMRNSISHNIFILLDKLQNQIPWPPLVTHRNNIVTGIPGDTITVSTNLIIPLRSFPKGLAHPRSFCNNRYKSLKVIPENEFHLNLTDIKSYYNLHDS